MIELILNYSVNHRVDLDSVKFWFDFFNEHIFENKLFLFDEIQIKRTKGYIGLCEHWYEWELIDGEWYKIDSYILILRNSLDFSDFLGTLGHEMVHLYQRQVLDSEMREYKEDPIFLEFNDKFKKFGINIL